MSLVPVAGDHHHLEGWTTCCAAAVTFHDATLICKACYAEVAPVALRGDASLRLAAIVSAVITGKITADEGVRMQGELTREALA